MPVSDATQLSQDTFLNGQITVWQYQKGYRFSVDAVLLASFYRKTANAYVLDVGCGCGIMLLLLGFWHPEVNGAGVEIQPELARLAMQNLMENGLAEKFTILSKDVKKVLAAEFDRPPTHLIVNPPFYAKGTGRKNPNEQQRIARHEEALTMTELLETANRLLEEGGKMLMIYPIERWAELEEKFGEYRFSVSRVCRVCSKKGQAPKLVMVEAIKGVGGVNLPEETSVVIYEEEGGYTEEMKMLFSGVTPNHG